jgi:glutamate synthase (NADPH/NADH) small chain
MQIGEAFTGIAGPLGQPSELHSYDPKKQTVVFTAGGVGLPPVYPIAREHLRKGNHVTLIAGFRSADLLFWTKENERVGKLQAEFGDLLDVIYCSNDGSFGIKGFVSTPLEEMLKNGKKSKGRAIAEVVTIGPPLMMRAVSDLTRPYGVKTVASLNSIMVDATGMCGACMVPVNLEGKLVRKHACVDGPEIDGHIIDWDKFLPRFNLFKPQKVTPLGSCPPLILSYHFYWYERVVMRVATPFRYGNGDRRCSHAPVETEQGFHPDGVRAGCSGNDP